METFMAETAHQGHRHNHHGAGRRHQSRRQRIKKVLQRLVIVLFLMIVMLALWYIWVSGGSAQASGQLLHAPGAEDIDISFSLG